MWRTFDIGAVVASLPIDGAVVVAGRSGMSRSVARARLGVTPEQLRHVEASDLVVTTAATLTGTGDDVDRLIGELDAAEIAGLVVRLDAGDALARDVVAAATRWSVPVITVPEHTDLADVGTAVVDALLDAQRQRLDRVLDVHRRFTDIVLGGGGTNEIAFTLHELTGHPVVIVDTDGAPAVVVPSDTDDAHARSTASPVRRAINASGEHYGDVVVLTGPRERLDADGLVALEQAAVAIAVRWAHAIAVAEAQERFAAITLEELVGGHAGDPGAIAERAVAFGWDLARPRAVLLASVDPPEEGVVAESALETIAASARATLGRDAIVWKRSATIAALLAPTSDAATERRELAESLRRALDERVRSVTVSIGVGRRVDTPAELARSFVEASHAVDVGRWAKGRHVTEVYDELGLERLLAATPTDDLAEFVQRAIGDLVQHDRTNNTDLVETLAAWLDTRNMAEGARRTYVHYNTFKNRLDRIEAILGPVLTNSARALECEVAIYVYRHYDGPWARTT